MSSPSYSRMHRVNSIIKKVLADEVEELKDPRVDMVTITGVETSPDLRHALVYFSTIDLSRSDEIKAALDHAAPRLRRTLGGQVRMKYTPSLEFYLDEGIVEGEKIEAIFRRIRERDGEDE